jgi:protein gp37
MKRWGKLNPVRFDNKELKTDLGKGNYIFVGSSCDMFSNAIPTKWIKDTLNYCKEFDNKYLFQTKNPQMFNSTAYDFLDDTVICTTIESNRVYPEIMVKVPSPYSRAFCMSKSSYNRYVTIEPILDFDLLQLVDLINMCSPIQVNIGADSGNNNLPEPSWEKVQLLIEELSKFTTISKKRNLDRLKN